MNYTQRRGVSGDPGQHGWREEQSLEKDVLHALLEILELEVDDYEDNDDMSRIRSRFKGNLCPPAAQKKCRAKSTILMLLSHATTKFVEEDLRPVLQYVQKKLSVEDLR